MTDLAVAVQAPVDLVVQIGRMVVTPDSEPRAAPADPAVADILDALRAGRPGVVLTGPDAPALARAAAAAWPGEPLVVATGTATEDGARALVADGAQAVVAAGGELDGLAVDGWALLRRGPGRPAARPDGAEPAVHLVRDALHRAGDSAGEATAWLQLAELAARGGRAAVALDRAGRAVTLFDACGAAADRARATVAVGEALLTLGEPGPALHAFAMARRDLPAGPDTGRALLGVADAITATGRDPRPTLARAAAAFAGHRAGRVGTLRRLGAAHTAAGDTAAALDAYRDALLLLDDPRAALLLGVLDGRVEVTVTQVDEQVRWPSTDERSDAAAVLAGLAELVPDAGRTLQAWRALSS